MCSQTRRTLRLQIGHSKANPARCTSAVLSCLDSHQLASKTPLTGHDWSSSLIQGPQGALDFEVSWSSASGASLIMLSKSTSRGPEFSPSKRHVSSEAAGASEAFEGDLERLERGLLAAGVSEAGGGGRFRIFWEGGGESQSGFAGCKSSLRVKPTPRLNTLQDRFCPTRIVLCVDSTAEPRSVPALH